jgi:hypothetical protein
MLNNLVMATSSLTEAEVEGIIEPYVRYDLVERRLLFTQRFTNLRSKTKILICLAAADGWNFIKNIEKVDEPTAQLLETQIGIPAERILSLIKELKRANIVVDVDGVFSLNPLSLAAIRYEINSSQPAVASRGKKRASSSQRDHRTKVRFGWL